jgi:hypothetical protein
MSKRIKLAAKNDNTKCIKSMKVIKQQIKLTFIIRMAIFIIFYFIKFNITLNS